MHRSQALSHTACSALSNLQQQDTGKKEKNRKDYALGVKLMRSRVLYWAAQGARHCLDCVSCSTAGWQTVVQSTVRRLRVTLGGFSSSLTLRPSTCTSVTLSPSLRKSVQVMTYAYLHHTAAKHWCRCFAYRTSLAWVQPESAIVGAVTAAVQTSLEAGG